MFRSSRFVLSAAIAACMPMLAQAEGVLTQVRFHPLTQIACDPGSHVCGVTDKETAIFSVEGTGKFDALYFDFGDGGRSFIPKVDLGDHGQTPLVVTHQYAGSWPGKKRVVVSSATDESTRRQMDINVLFAPGIGAPMSVFRADLGMPHRDDNTPWTNSCATVGGMNPLRNRVRVTISKVSTAEVKINFGCWFNGCVYDADGQPGSSADGNFPYHGKRKYSLVLKVNDQIEQGGNNAEFFTGSNNGEAPLQFCVNDDNLGDNHGDWGIGIAVDETLSDGPTVSVPCLGVPNTCIPDTLIEGKSGLQKK